MKIVMVSFVAGLNGVVNVSAVEGLPVVCTKEGKVVLDDPLLPLEVHSEDVGYIVNPEIGRVTEGFCHHGFDHQTRSLRRDLRSSADKAKGFVLLLIQIRVGQLEASIDPVGNFYKDSEISSGAPDDSNQTSLRILFCPGIIRVRIGSLVFSIENKSSTGITVLDQQRRSMPIVCADSFKGDEYQPTLNFPELETAAWKSKNRRHLMDLLIRQNNRLSRRTRYLSDALNQLGHMELSKYAHLWTAQGSPPRQYTKRNQRE